MAATIVRPSSSSSQAPNIALSVRELQKTFGSRDSLTHALDGISFDVARSEFVGIMGPSGSGKTTLLNCISTIDRPTSGRIVVGGREVTALRGAALAKFRREELGFVFQDSNLIPTLTAHENIALALTIKRVPTREVDDRVRAIARELGVEDVLQKFPSKMSGGQRQRVAAARAFVTQPQLVLADEPTGALDSRNASILMQSLQTLNHEVGSTIMMVTHDPFAASWASRILFIRDGKLFSELNRGDADRKAFFGRVMEVMALMGGEDEHVR